MDDQAEIGTDLPSQPQDQWGLRAAEFSPDAEAEAVFGWLCEFVRELASPRPDYHRDPTWRQADSWYHAFHASDGVDYRRLIDYANARLSGVHESYAVLDSKAEWCFGLAAALVGIIFAGVQKFDFSGLLLIPSFLSLFISMMIALRVRLPGDVPSGTAVRHAVEQLPKEPNFDAWLVSSIHCAVVGVQVINKWKARQLVGAAAFLAIGLLLLLLPLLVTQSDKAPPEAKFRLVGITAGAASYRLSDCRQSMVVAAGPEAAADAPKDRCSLQLSSIGSTALFLDRRIAASRFDVRRRRTLRRD